MSLTIRDVVREVRGENITVVVKKVFSVSTRVSGYGKCYLQGGGSDGEYAYYIINEAGDTGSERSKLLKVDKKSWRIVGEAQDFLWGHANDLTYDSRSGRLVVSHCNKDVSFVDPQTLTELGRATLKTDGQYAIAYEPSRNMYAIGKSRCYDLGILDSSLELIASHEGEDGHVKQGMECDEEFIYFLQSGVRHNWIWIYDWEGRYRNKLKLPMLGEGENVFAEENSFVVGFNNFKNETADVYEITAVPNPSLL